MNHVIENIRKTRSHVINIIQNLSLEKMNKIPHGFNNNIIWNVGHLVAAQQAICYTKAGLPPAIPEEVFAEFNPGSRPERFIESDEEDEIKKILFSSLDLLENDYHNNVFQKFSPWTNRMGITMNNINEAIQYLQFHEGLHTGVITSIRKLIQK
jgi:hypothetical protein